MKIMTSHRLGFESKEGALFTSAGGNTVENAPDWIAETDLFRAAKAAGQLTEMEVAPVAATTEPEAVEFTPEPTVEEVAEEAQAEASEEPEAPESEEVEKPKRGRKAKADAEEAQAE